MYNNSVFRLFEKNSTKKPKKVLNCIFENLKKSREQYNGIYSVCINLPLAVPGCADRQLEQAGNHFN